MSINPKGAAITRKRSAGRPKKSSYEKFENIRVTVSASALMQLATVPKGRRSEFVSDLLLLFYKPYLRVRAKPFEKDSPKPKTFSLHPAAWKLISESKCGNLSEIVTSILEDLLSTFVLKFKKYDLSDESRARFKRELYDLAHSSIGEKLNWLGIEPIFMHCYSRDLKEREMKRSLKAVYRRVKELRNAKLNKELSALVEMLNALFESYFRSSLLFPLTDYEFLKYSERLLLLLDNK